MTRHLICKIYLLIILLLLPSALIKAQRKVIIDNIERSFYGNRQDAFKTMSFILNIKRNIDTSVNDINYGIGLTHRGFMFDNRINLEKYFLVNFNARKRYELNLGLNIFYYLTKQINFNEDKTKLTFISSCKLLTGLFYAHVFDNSTNKSIQQMFIAVPVGLDLEWSKMVSTAITYQKYISLENKGNLASINLMFRVNFRYPVF